MALGDEETSGPLEVFAAHERVYERLSMNDLIGLADRLAAVLQRRFGTRLSLAFTDIVDSTAHFTQHGDEAGRRMQHRHLELLQRVVAKEGGRIVDTAGDGAFLCFPTVDRAVRALGSLLEEISARNAQRAAGDQFAVRCGVHWGEVLSDGVNVRGHAVNLAARIAGTSGKGEIRVTDEAFRHLSSAAKVRCKPLPPVTLKGFPEPVNVLAYEWQKQEAIPVAVRIAERAVTIPLPDRALISFGRSAESGPRANDIVLSHPDDMKSQLISRWHFVLRREPRGFFLRNDSRDVEVDGVAVPTGQEAPIEVGSVVRVAGVLTLTFLGKREGPASPIDDVTLVLTSSGTE